MEIKKAELLAPAGDMEKLQIAIAYGADAVYLGGTEYGLRANSKNFDAGGLREAISLAHRNNVKVYVTVNIFAKNSDLASLPEYLRSLEAYGADAILIADPGVFMLARETVPDLDIHSSTQANSTNSQSALFWHSLGAKRIVAARELSLAEIRETKQMLPPDMGLEVFVHGAMCISYSGRCLLSSYLTGRDSNKGDCAQPCRWKYGIMEETRPGEFFPVEEDESGTFILNSKDLCMIGHLPELLDAGVTSLKIEGRMKTPFYVGTVVKAYRDALDDYYRDLAVYSENIPRYMEEVLKVSHRVYTTGFYFGAPGASGQIYESSSYIRDYDFIAMVEEDSDTGTALVSQRNRFRTGEEIEVLPAKGMPFKMTVGEMENMKGEKVTSAPHPTELLKLHIPGPVRKFDMLRRASGKNKS